MSKRCGTNDTSSVATCEFSTLRQGQESVSRLQQVFEDEALQLLSAAGSVSQHAGPYGNERLDKAVSVHGPSCSSLKVLRVNPPETAALFQEGQPSLMQSVLAPESSHLSAINRQTCRGFHRRASV